MILAGLEVIGSELLICDPGSGRISRFDDELGDIATHSATQPWNLTRIPDSELLAVTRGGGVGLFRAGTRPQVLFSWLDAPFDIVADEDGDVWVSKQGAQGEGWVTLRQPGGGSEVTRVGPFDNPEGLVLAQDGTLWIADTVTGKICRKSSI